VIDALGTVLTAVDFVAPAVALWYLVLRRTEDRLSSALAIAGLSAFLVPSFMFLLNRTFGYPLERAGMTGLAIALVAGSVAWHWLLAPRLGPLRGYAIRLGEIVGGTFPSERDRQMPPDR
jgi:hypothetical protein